MVQRFMLVDDLLPSTNSKAPIPEGAQLVFGDFRIPNR